MKYSGMTCATVVLRLENGHVVNNNSVGEMKGYEREKEKCYSTAV
jgi:energy-coupling factor transport system ATP-binding protein